MIWHHALCGPWRAENQDRTVFARDRTLVVGVVDGMGGGVDGAAAAELAVEVFGRLAERTLCEDAAQRSALEAHQAIVAERAERGHLEQMGAVATVFWVDVDHPGWPYLVIHVGDARGFAFSPDGCGRQLTRDQAAVDYGELPDSVALERPLRNYVTAALGSGGDAQVAAGRLEPGSVLLAASDGVGDYLPRIRMAALVGRHVAVGELGRAVLAAALARQQLLQRGDNLAVAVLRRPYPCT